MIIANIMSQQGVNKLLYPLALLVFSSHIVVPCYPVNITLQSLAVLYLGLKQPNDAMKAYSIYIGLGVLGLPVFNEPGISKLLGPAGGYYIGFAACILSLKYSQGLGLLTRLGLAWVALYIPGIFGLCSFMDFNDAIYFGVIPFIIPGIIKTSLLYMLFKCKA